MEAVKPVQSVAPPSPVQPLAFSIADAQRAAGNPSRGFIYNEARAGRLRITKLGRRSVILAEDLLAWLRASDDKPNPKYGAAGRAKARVVLAEKNAEKKKLKEAANAGAQ